MGLYELHDRFNNEEISKNKSSLLSLRKKKRKTRTKNKKKDSSLKKNSKHWFFFVFFSTCLNKQPLLSNIGLVGLISQHPIITLHF